LLAIAIIASDVLDCLYSRLRRIIVGVGLYFHMAWATAVVTDVVYWSAHQEQQRLQPGIDHVLKVIATKTSTATTQS